MDYNLDPEALRTLLDRFFLVLVGLSVGSFTTVFASRYPRGESLWRPGSRCPRCMTPIKFYDNIPVLGWLLLGGRCRRCRARIALRYPLMELSFGLTTLLLAWRLAPGLEAAYWTAFFWGLLLIAWVDWETSYIYDVTTYPLLAMGLASGWLFPGLYQAWWSPLAGAALMFVLMEGSYQLVRATTGREALGGGDVKLMAAVGAFLGPWASMRAVVFVSILSPLYWLAAKKAKGLNNRDAFPFGPALAAGCALSAYEFLTGDLGRLARQAGLGRLAETLLF